MVRRIPAIPTDYNGIRFRSKLEARYAKAFDSLNISWEYEGIGFEFDDGTRYCPDFHLPKTDQFFEVKGAMDQVDGHKIYSLAQEYDVIVGDCDGFLTIQRKGSNKIAQAHIFVTDYGYMIDADREVEIDANIKRMMTDANSIAIGKPYRWNNFFDDVLLFEDLKKYSALV